MATGLAGPPPPPGAVGAAAAAGGPGGGLPGGVGGGLRRRVGGGFRRREPAPSRLPSMGVCHICQIDRFGTDIHAHIGDHWRGMVGIQAVIINIFGCIMGKSTTRWCLYIIGLDKSTW